MSLVRTSYISLLAVWAESAVACLLMGGGTLLAAEAPQSSALTSEASKFTGPGSCSSTSCHGGVQPRAETSVRQNEYSLWVVRDKHAHAFAVLSNPVGTRMARILGLPRADTAEKCLACHALNPPPDQRAKTFSDLTDGVSCEACHGPASNWLGPHTTRGWAYEKSLQAGMYNTRDLIKRSEKCLSCHLGNEEKFVDHEMIAAGHPDLYFELDSFSAAMPRHWKEPLDKDPWLGVRTLGTGQAVQLREHLRRVARRAQGSIWPEFSELQCFACHHDLTAAKDSWRQERGYPGRRPGDPPFNMSRYSIFRQVVYEVDRQEGGQLDSQLNKLFGLMSELSADRKQVVAAAESSAELADRLARRIASLQFDQGMTMRLLKSISGDADYIAGQGERSAEQAAMALDSLFIAYIQSAKMGNEQQVRAAINSLFQELSNPSAYNAYTFAREVHKLNALLP
ncbi:MAG: hypothetical protein HY236_06370 [Acidobacteria bacterium]|nr:hypothetical protein [Acidobacteriota bacterium]